MEDIKTLNTKLSDVAKLWMNTLTNEPLVIVADNGQGGAHVITSNCSTNDEISFALTMLNHALKRVHPADAKTIKMAVMMNVIRLLDENKC